MKKIFITFLTSFFLGAVVLFSSAVSAVVEEPLVRPIPQRLLQYRIVRKQIAMYLLRAGRNFEEAITNYTRTLGRHPDEPGLDCTLSGVIDGEARRIAEGVKYRIIGDFYVSERRGEFVRQVFSITAEKDGIPYTPNEYTQLTCESEVGIPTLPEMTPQEFFPLLSVFGLEAPGFVEPAPQEDDLVFHP